MNKKVDPNTKHYFQITSAQELSEVLIEKFHNKKDLKITLWEKGEDEKNAELYNFIEFDSQNKKIKINPTGHLLTNITGSLKTGKQILVKIPIDEKTNFFTGGLLLFQRETLSYSLQIQQDIFISQQRSNFRLNANIVIQIQFKIENNVYDAHDISVGGTSFKIPKADIGLYEKGKIFENCTIRFDRKNYHIPKALISNLMPIFDEAGIETANIKVGISFQDLSQGTRDELNIKISIEARGDEMKKKFDDIFAKTNF
jgi:hypothetical protein